MKINIRIEFINKDNKKVQIDKEFEFTKNVKHFESILNEIGYLLIEILKENTNWRTR